MCSVEEKRKMEARKGMARFVCSKKKEDNDIPRESCIDLYKLRQPTKEGKKREREIER